jgi:hypothetical protein
VCQEEGEGGPVKEWTHAPSLYAICPLYCIGWYLCVEGILKSDPMKPQGYVTFTALPFPTSRSMLRHLRSPTNRTTSPGDPYLMLKTGLGLLSHCGTKGPFPISRLTPARSHLQWASLSGFCTLSFVSLIPPYGGGYMLLSPSLWVVKQSSPVRGLPWVPRYRSL